ncbi:MAG: protoporphyrinogen oxidase [Bacteroidia bacterium]|nr:protoporphyrinogen oxidase [Bacteroidia bacterium]
MITIVGAGITGLVTAAYLKKSGFSVQLFDSREQAGGNIRSFQKGRYLLELGPNSLVLNDELYNFLEEWGLDDHILQADPKAKFRFILKKGKYRKLPTGPISLLTSRTLSFKAKGALIKERNLPPQFVNGDSIDAFFRKRLGDEWTDYVVYPFISGVFAGDPRQLLIEKAFPRILKLEEEHSSLIRGMMANRKSQNHRGTISFSGGIQQMTNRLGHYLRNELFLDHPLLAIREGKDKKWGLQFKQKEIETDWLVLCIPSYQAGRLIREFYSETSIALNQVEYPPVSMVYSAYKRKAVKHKLNGFGALHNHKEKSFALGSIFNSSVFPDRCPEDEVLLTTFVGGAMYPERAKLENEELCIKVNEELSKLLGIREKPVMQHVQRWPRAIPQYTEGFLASDEQKSSLEDKGIFLSGNWTGGISVPDSIKSGQELAKKLMSLKDLPGR